MNEHAGSEMVAEDSGKVEIQSIDFKNLLPENRSHASHAAFRARIIEILERKGEILPSPDSVLGRLWKAIQSEESSLEHCAAIIKLDPALTARVFRLANSPAYGGKTTTIVDAVLKLGFSQIRQVAFNEEVFAEFSKFNLPAGWSPFWLRNIFIARLAERISSFYFTPDGSEYLAGLLHDAGWLFLATFTPEEFLAVLNDPLPAPGPERSLLGMTHADISAAVCARSRLPHRTVNAVIHHHAPSLIAAGQLSEPKQSARFLGTILCLCDKLADHCGLQFIKGEAISLEEIQNGPEVAWLSHFKRQIRFDALIEQELPKAREVVSLFL